jgi:hypothetical protein
MSAIPSKADIHLERLGCPLCAKSRHSALRRRLALFDHLVGADEQRRWDGQVEHRGGLIVDNQFELVRLHDRQVRRLGTLEDAAGISASLAPCIRNVGSIAHKPASIGKFARTK